MEDYTYSQTMQGLFIHTLIITNIIIIEQLWQKNIDMFGSSTYPVPESCQLKVYALDNSDTVEHFNYSILLGGIDPQMTITIHRKFIKRSSVSGI